MLVRHIAPWGTLRDLRLPSTKTPFTLVLLIFPAARQSRGSHAESNLPRYPGMLILRS